MKSDQLIDDIVAMLDQTMTEGTGHINLTVKGENVTFRTIETQGSADCGEGDKACKVPTLENGLDDKNKANL